MHRLRFSRARFRRSTLHPLLHSGPVQMAESEVVK
jgi:hypothetical protein